MGKNIRKRKERREEENNDEHKERRTLGGATINNQGTAGLRQSTDFPDHIKRVLDLYRVVI